MKPQKAGSNGGFVSGRHKKARTKARFLANAAEIHVDLLEPGSFTRVAKKWSFDTRTLRRLLSDEVWEAQATSLKGMFTPKVTQPTTQEQAPKASETQVGGDHYRNLKIQPAEYCTANKLPYLESAVVKYITRWRDKGGLQDLDKAKHIIDLIKEMELKYGDATRPSGLRVQATVSPGGSGGRGEA